MGRNRNKRKREFLSKEFQDVHDHLGDCDLNPHGWTGGNRAAASPSLSLVVTNPTTTPLPPDTDLLKQLLGLQGVKLAPVDPLDPTLGTITWVLASNGIFQLRKTRWGVVTVAISKTPIPMLLPQPVTVALNIPKLPWDLFRIGVAFLRAVNKEMNTEGLVRFYRSTTGWYLHIPKQAVSAGSVDIDNDEPHPTGYTNDDFAVEVHSHPGSSSVFSSIDDANEQRERIFGCVADLASMKPNFHFRIGTGIEKWQDIELSDIVEDAQPITFNLTPHQCLTKTYLFDPFHDAVFPRNWMNQVTKKVYNQQGKVVTGPVSSYTGNDSKPSLLPVIHFRGGLYFRNPSGRLVDWKTGEPVPTTIENAWINASRAERTEAYQNGHRARLVGSTVVLPRDGD